MTLISIASCQLVFADGSVTLRKNCLGKNVRPRYATLVSVKPPNVYYMPWGDHKTSCDNNITSYYNWTVGGVIKAEAWAEAGPSTYPNGRITYKNYTTDRGVTFGANTIDLIPDYSFPAMIDDPKSKLDPKFEADIQVGEIYFDEQAHGIGVKQITGSLDIVSDDIANRYHTLLLRVYDETNGTIEDGGAAVIYEAKAMVVNGTVIVDGDFATSDFSTSNVSETSISVMPKTINRFITVPAELDLDNVAVELAVDGGTVGEGVPGKYSIADAARKANVTTTPQFDFDILGNPATGALKYSITSSDEAISNMHVELISMDGKTIYKGSSVNIIPSQQYVAQIDVTNYAAGSYLLRAVTNTGKTYSRKVILNK